MIKLLIPLVVLSIFAVDFLTNFETEEVVEPVTKTSSVVKPSLPPKTFVEPEETVAPIGERNVQPVQPSPVQQYSAPSVQQPEQPVAETAEQRVLRLARQVGIGVPTYIDYCYIPGYNSADIRACFMPFQQVIYVSPSTLNYDDSFVLCILAHEARHAWQYTNGMFQYDSNGNITNREWLEADATAYSGCS